MATQAQPRDAMQFINEQSAATLERFIERLEFRGSDPAFAAYRDEYLELIDLPNATAVLDLGCGTGVVARAIAARTRGTVTGVDQSPHFIAAARRRAAEEGLGDRVELAVGDAHELDLAAASFDAVVAHTLVSHVRDPRAVLAQAARVTRPGGTVAVFDGDYASLTFGSADARARPGDGARAAGDDHELAPGHARAPAPAAGGGAAAHGDAGPRVRRGGVGPLHAQPGRDLRAARRRRPARCPPRTSRRGSPISAAPPRTARSSRPATTTPTSRPEPHDAAVGCPRRDRPARLRAGPARRSRHDRRFVPAVIAAIGMRAHGPLMLDRFGDGELEGWSATAVHRDQLDHAARRRGPRAAASSTSSPAARSTRTSPRASPPSTSAARRACECCSDDRRRARARRARRSDRHRRHDPLRRRHPPRNHAAAPGDVADLECARDRGVPVPARRRRLVEPAHGGHPGRPHQPCLPARDRPRRGRHEHERRDH